MSSFSKLNYINAGPGGTFRPSGDPDYDTTPQDADAIFAFLTREKISTLTLYFHGGLVSISDGMEGAKRITARLEGIAGHHTVCMIWETGILKVLSENIREISGLTLFKKLVKLLMKAIGKKLGMTEGARGVATMTDAEIEAELSKDFPFEQFFADASSRSSVLTQLDDTGMLERQIEAELRIEYQRDAELQALVEAAEPEDEKARGLMGAINFIKKAGKIAMAVLRRLLNGTDHGAYITLVEEILRGIFVDEVGKLLWDGMKKKAAQMWDSNEGLSGNDLHAGRYFLEKLSAHCAANPGFRLNLAGHSAGSIAICRLVQTLAENDLHIPIRDVIFLAPAVRHDVFHEQLLKRRNLFSRFRMFTMCDDLESHDRLAWVFYNRSLLYFVSGLCEGEEDAHILGMERYLSGNSPYDTQDYLAAARAFFAEDKARMVLSETKDSALAGFRTLAKSHGDFDEEKETLDSVFEMIRA